MNEDISILYKKVFGTIDGHKVLDDINNFTGLDKISVDFNNVNGTFFLQGQRNVSIHIKEKLELNLEKKQEIVDNEKF